MSEDRAPGKHADDNRDGPGLIEQWAEMGWRSFGSNRGTFAFCLIVLAITGLGAALAVAIGINPAIPVVLLPTLTWLVAIGWVALYRPGWFGGPKPHFDDVPAEPSVALTADGRGGDGASVTADASHSASASPSDGAPPAVGIDRIEARVSLGKAGGVLGVVLISALFLFAAWEHPQNSGDGWFDGGAVVLIIIAVPIAIWKWLPLARGAILVIDSDGILDRRLKRNGMPFGKIPWSAIASVRASQFRSMWSIYLHLDDDRWRPKRSIAYTENGPYIVRIELSMLDRSPQELMEFLHRLGKL